MATVRVWALHGNIQNAINYICQDKKTYPELKERKDGAIPVAGIEWKTEKSNGNDNNISTEEIVGFHFQQSFEVGSISYEEAFEIGKQWIEKITGRQYDYVMAVHTDKPNPHVHFVVNPINKVTGKQMQIFYKKDLPTFKEISDRICVEHGKAILEQPHGKGKTYYEWMMENQGDGLKEVIAKTLDYAISKVQNYDDLKSYLTKLGYKIEDGLNEGGNTSTFDENDITGFSEYKFSVHKSLFVKERETETHYFVRVPNTKGKEYIMLPKDHGDWTSNQDVFFTSFLLANNFDVFNKEGNIIEKKSAKEIKNCWEDKNEKNNRKERQGLRIQPPNAKKFIRCHNIEANKDGLGYSLNDVLERIESNGRLRTDDKVLKFIHKDNVDYSEVNKEVNKLNGEANIHTKWENSKWHNMTKKERFVAYKTKEVQQRLNNIHNRRIGVNDIEIIEALREDRNILRNDLKEVIKELKKQEAYYEEIYIDMLADTLEATQSELDGFIKEQIEPLQKQKENLKNEISDISKRINVAETKLANHSKREEL